MRQSPPTAFLVVVRGLTYGGGRLANVAGPFIVAWVYAGLGYESVFAFVAGCHVLRGRGFAIYGPRTTGRSLEQINEPLPSRTRHATHPARL